MANQTLREANFYASTPLYYMAGAFWLYRGSLKEFLKNLKNIS
jgi:putative heme iron utilization protein